MNSLAWMAVAAVGVGALATMLALEVRARGRESGAPAWLQPHALNVEAMLWAIRQVESGDNPRAIGRRGERSAYQFTAATWAEHTRLPFLMATMDARAAEQVAREHLARILTNFQVRRIEPAPEFIGAAWNGGIGSAFAHSHHDYARRVANLYWDRIEGVES